MSVVSLGIPFVINEDIIHPDPNPSLVITLPGEQHVEGIFVGVTRLQVAGPTH